MTTDQEVHLHIPSGWPVPKGWVGGFTQSNPEFSYPSPNLEWLIPPTSSEPGKPLPMLGNMDNIDKLQRCQIVEWPEFSWKTQMGQADPKRCYQRFASEISRLGYTDTGRIYSIICPQQGFSSPTLGSINVEVTVTGNRGWVDEISNDFAGDMSVVGKIWFSPSAMEKDIVKSLLFVFQKLGLPFPLDKSNAIEITTFKPGYPDQPIFPLRKGQSTGFPIPDFAKHTHTAWSVGHLGVEIGPIKATESEIVNDFNELIMWVFNSVSGNMLQNGNVLTWNVWFTHPILVDQEEWRTHAERWRKSIDADHGSPHGDGQKAKYFDGTPFSPLVSLEEEGDKVKTFLKKHLKQEYNKIVSFLKKIF